MIGYISDNSVLLFKLISILNPKPIPKQTDELRGCVYVTTGSFDGCKRSEVEKLIISKGGKISSKVKPKITGLIYGSNGGRS